MIDADDTDDLLTNTPGPVESFLLNLEPAVRGTGLHVTKEQTENCRTVEKMFHQDLAPSLSLSLSLSLSPPPLSLSLYIYIYNHIYIYLPTPPLGQDMIQGQFLSGV